MPTTTPTPTPAPISPSDVDDVLAQVRERGFITTAEIFTAFPDLEPGFDDLRNLLEMFESRGIRVLDDGGVVAAKAHVAPHAPVESRMVKRDPSRRLQMPPEDLILGLDSGRRLICSDLHEPLSAIIERDDHFVLVSNVGIATSVDVHGAIKWSNGPAAAPSSARPFEDFIVLSSRFGLSTINADTGDAVWQRASAPSASLWSNGRLLWMTEDELALVQPGSGEAVWTWQDATVGAFKELAVWRDRVFVTARNALVAMTFDGQVQWTTYIAALRATNHPWIDMTDGTHIVTTPWRGRRIVLDARSGEVVASPPVPVDPWPDRDKQQDKWNREVGIAGRTFVQWHRANGRLEIVGSDIFTGKTLWKRRPLLSPTVGLLIDDGVLRVVARSPGRMAAIDPSTGRLRDEHTDIWWDYGLNRFLITSAEREYRFYRGRQRISFHWDIARDLYFERGMATPSPAARTTTIVALSASPRERWASQRRPGVVARLRSHSCSLARVAIPGRQTDPLPGRRRRF